MEVAGGALHPPGLPGYGGGGLRRRPRPSSEPGSPALSIRRAGGQAAGEQGGCWSGPACRLGRGSSDVQPPDAALARRVITAGPQPRPGLKGHSTARQPMCLQASLMCSLPWGYASCSDPEATRPSRGRGSDYNSPKEMGAQGRTSSSWAVSSPPPPLPPSNVPTFRPLCPAAGWILPFPPFPRHHLRTLSSSLLRSGHSLGFFTQPTSPVRSGYDPTALNTSTGP